MSFDNNTFYILVLYNTPSNKQKMYENEIRLDCENDQYWNYRNNQKPQLKSKKKTDAMMI